VGRDCHVWASIVEGSELEDEVRVGPYAHLRPGTTVGRGSEVGNYAELKATRLGAGVKQHHVSYLGDAELGAGTNVGAGTITANFDGRAKHRTRVGRNAFLGVDTVLIAPVEVGDDGRTGAGAVVTHDVAPGQLVVGVPARPRLRREPAPRPAPPDEAG
jgi:bifunctional UDP-N-acetylglucosamine pyrophosphorylase/glucosamine-1-phosphate N-acetyltransferase